MQEEQCYNLITKYDGRRIRTKMRYPPFPPPNTAAYEAAASKRPWVNFQSSSIDVSSHTAFWRMETCYERRWQNITVFISCMGAQLGLSP